MEREALEALVRSVFLVGQALRVGELTDFVEVSRAAALSYGVASEGYADLTVIQTAHLKVIQLAWQLGLLCLDSLLVSAPI